MFAFSDGALEPDDSVLEFGEASPVVAGHCGPSVVGVSEGVLGTRTTGRPM